MGHTGAATIANQVRQRELSPSEALDGALDSIRRCDPAVNAFTHVLESSARAEAQVVERALSRGEPAGALAGVPVAIKDAIWVAGVPATNGSRALLDFVPDVDALPVARLRQAGALIVGKTNNPELCYRGITDNAVYGRTVNPWATDRTPGGSSGGSAAAVAYGAVPLALGTDGGGSIRIPASFCGVAGLKPSVGRVPPGSGFRGWETLTVVGPLAWDAADLGLCMAVLAGANHDAGEGPDARTLRLAYSADLGCLPVEPAVRQAFDKAVATMGAEGWRVEEAHPAVTHDIVALWNEIAICEGYAADRHLLDREPDALEPDTRRLLEAGRGRSAAEYLDAMWERLRYGQAWQALFECYDVLLTPAMPVTAFSHGRFAPVKIDGRPVDQFFDDWCALSLPANLLGTPAASVVCGYDQNDLPIGLQVTGGHDADELVIAVAVAWESLFASRRRRPFPER